MIKSKVAIKAQQIAEAKESLLNMIKPNDTVYTVVHKVSSSGMSRTISAYIVKDGAIVNINWYIERLDMHKRNDQGQLKVFGCGMDMAFNIVYNLGRTLWPEGTKEAHGRRNGKPDTDGGYAIKHSWL